MNLNLRTRRWMVFSTILVSSIVVLVGQASACGGFFCQNSPVDQTGERIVFTVNDDDTITTLIEIQYAGSAEDFSWILPIPEAIGVDDLQVPEDGQAVFDELHRLTDVQIISPEQPKCADEMVFATAEMAESADDAVEVFASGEVGPFGFDVVGSEDPNALVGWLRDSNYQVTPEMEPLINHYVEQEMAFVAMRLLDGETAESIIPIEITYGGTEPMIPLVLTAVAALPNMPVWVWIFGDERAVSTNFANMEIANEEITFFPFGGHDYTFLVQQRADALAGQAFITEFAGPAESLDLTHPWLLDQAGAQPYLTRFNTYIDPAEMTVDPIFGFDASLPDVSNIRDASGLDGLYSCERDGDEGIIESLFGGSSDAIDPRDGGATVVAFTPGVEVQTEAEPDSGSDIEAPSDDTSDNGDDEGSVASERDDDSEAPEEGSSGWIVWFAVGVAFFGAAVAIISSRDSKD